MNEWQEMKAYVGFGAEDSARLQILHPMIAHQVEGIVDRFYARIRDFEGARAVLSSEAQIERLQKTLIRWVDELLVGPHDDAYHQKRLRIGEVHVRVGLPERYVFTAMNLIRRDLCAAARRVVDAEEAVVMCDALTKITDLELAVMSSTYRAAHEARELEGLQTAIIENLPSTVLCLGADGRVTASTHPSDRLFDGGEDSDRIERFLPADFLIASQLQQRREQAKSTGREVVVPRINWGVGDSARHFRLSVVPLSHHLADTLIHIEEFSDVVRAEASARQAEALARIGRLSANVAHEIRNPLTSISATLQVIESSFEDEDRRGPVLKKVRAEVHRLDRLVTDMLGFARQPRPELGVTDLGEVAREAREAAKVECGVFVDHLATRCWGDATLLQQVVINLLQNARDAAGGADRVRCVVGPGPRLAVVDDGPGIPEVERPQIFEAFFTTKSKGTGLGLAICQKLVDSMDGDIRVVPADDLVEGWTGVAFVIELREDPPE